MASHTLDELLASIRWLSPDAALDRLSDEALLSIRSAADELTGIWQQHAGPSVELPLIEPYVTRSAADALQRWTKSTIAADTANGGLYAQDRAPWITAHNAVLHRRMDAEQSAPALREAIHRFRALIEARGVALPPAWGPAWNALLPGFFTVFRHWWSGAKIQETHPTLPSPWAPLVSLWARGCWPVLAPNGELIVWVPATRDRGIVADADSISARPLDVMNSRLFGGELLPPGPLPIVLTVVGGKMFVQALSRINSIDLQSGTIAPGSASAKTSATIERQSVEGQADRYALAPAPNCNVLLNGAAATQSLLAPGDALEIQRDNDSTTVAHYLRIAVAGAECEMPQYDPLKAPPATPTDDTE